jgi:UrcA family protein
VKMQTCSTLHRCSLPIASAVLAVCLVGASARADELNQVTIHGSTVKTIGHAKTGQPIEQVTVRITVPIDPVMFTTNSGVALVKDRVLDAAKQACKDPDPAVPEDQDCVRRAFESAQPEIDAEIAKANRSPKG